MYYIIENIFISTWGINNGEKREDIKKLGKMIPEKGDKNYKTNN